MGEHYAIATNGASLTSTSTTMDDSTTTTSTSSSTTIDRAVRVGSELVLGTTAISNSTREWKLKRASFPTQNEYERRHLWAQILSKGEEIARHATDAHKRDFTREEMQQVETLALSILTEVRKLIGAETRHIEPPPQAPQTLTFVPTTIAPPTPVPEPVQELGGDQANRPRKRRGRPPIKKPLFCAECGTTETPEWRRGENGPNTLCNGCGLRYAKKRKQEAESRKKHSIDVLLNEKRAQQQAAAAALAGALVPVPDNAKPVSVMPQSSAAFSIGPVAPLAGTASLLTSTYSTTATYAQLDPETNKEGGSDSGEGESEDDEDDEEDNEEMA